MTKKILPMCVKETVPVERIDSVATGQKMRSLRKRHRISLTEIGETLGMNLSALSLLETGKRTWNEEKAARYAEAVEKIVANDREIA